MTELNFSEVFAAEKGDAFVYRSPSAIVTAKGTVVAMADKRHFTGSTIPNKIEIVVRRSTDNGENWGEQRTIVEEVGQKKDFSSASFNVCMAYNSETNRIIAIYTHTPSGTNMLNCRLGTGEDAKGHRFVFKSSRKYILMKNKLYNYAKKTYAGFCVDDRGYYFKDGKTVSSGNIRLIGGFKEMGTAYLMMTYSDDDGISWSKPHCINTQIKTKYMGFIATGTGGGITLKKGEHKGRIIIPVYFNVGSYPLRLSNAVIYSDDNGENWAMGASPNSIRKNRMGKPLNLRTVTPSYMLAESQLIERDDGTLKMFIRSYDKLHCLASAYSINGGENWNDFKMEKQLISPPNTPFSLAKVVHDDKEYIVLANPASKTQRINGTVRLSDDLGESFAYAKVVAEKEFLASVLVQLQNGQIALLFEGASRNTTIRFTTFDVDWIKTIQVQEEEVAKEDTLKG